MYNKLSEVTIEILEDDTLNIIGRPVQQGWKVKILSSPKRPQDIGCKMFMPEKALESGSNQ